MSTLQHSPVGAASAPGRVAARVVAALVAVVALGPGPAGCNVVAPVAYAIEGPPKTPAVFKLPDKPTVVFIDDRRNVLGVRADSLRRSMAENISTQLMQSDVLTTTIEPRAALVIARQQDRHNEVMPIGEIGRSVGAQQVIYVEMVRFSSTSDGVTLRPTAQCGIKVIDVAGGQRLFPGADQAMYPLPVVMRPMTREGVDSRSDAVQIYEILARQVADKVAKVFYEHETRELGGNLEPR